MRLSNWISQYLIKTLRSKDPFQISDLSNKKIYFISPHLDDAVLSAGSFISKLIASGSKVTVVTIFTKGSKKPYSAEAIAHLKNSGFTDTEKLFRARIAEDKKALGYLGANYKHFNFVDAAFRKDADGHFIYTKNEQFSGRMSEKDFGLLNLVKKEILKLLKTKNTYVFGPMGIGGHVDHIIVRKAVEDIPNKKIFWEDFPYNLDLHNKLTLLTRMRRYKKIISLDTAIHFAKNEAIRKYKSQLKGLFPDGQLKNLPENYYVKI